MRSVVTRKIAGSSPVQTVYYSSTTVSIPPRHGGDVGAIPIYDIFLQWCNGSIADFQSVCTGSNPVCGTLMYFNG